MVKHAVLPGGKADEIVPFNRWSRHFLRVAVSTVAGCLAALSLTAAAAHADTYGKRITNARTGLHADVLRASQYPDFNGDGRTDLALVRQTPGWHTIPSAFSTGNG